MDELPWQKQVREMVGGLSVAEAGMLLGRRSATRLAAQARGLEQYLPLPPSVEQDESLAYAAAEEMRRAKRLSVRRVAPNRGVTRSIRLQRLAAAGS